MLRTVLATAATFAITTGVASAQGAVPGAAAVEGYHERFANDSKPERSPPPSSGLFEWQLPVAEPGIDETVVLRPVPAPIPDREVAPSEPAPPPAGPRLRRYE